jgi:hypothetical protein
MIASFLLISALGMYLINFKIGMDSSFWLFWFCTISLTLLITFQISRIHPAQITNIALILLQVILVAFFLRFLFISVEHPLNGYDVYNELITLSEIAKLNYWYPGAVSGHAASYPIAYFNCLIRSYVLDSSLHNIVKWTPLSLYFISTLVVYKIGQTSYSYKAGLLASFGFSLLYISLFLHTTLTRETMALPLFLIAIYATFAAVKMKKTEYIYIAVISSISCILTHHLTSFLLLVFLLLYFCIAKLSTIKRLQRVISKETTLLSYFVVCVIVCTLGFWALLHSSPLYFFDLIFTEATITEPSYRSMVIPDDIRYSILLYGEIAFAFLFGVLALLSIYLMKEGRTAFDLTLFTFSGFTGMLMVLLLFGKLFQDEGMGLGSRLQTFVYLGLFLLPCYLLHVTEVKPRVNWKKVLTIMIYIIFVGFILLNIYRLPIYLYSDYDFQQGEPRGLITEAEYHAAEFLGLGRNDVIADGSLNGDLIYAGYTGQHKWLSDREIPDLVILHSQIIPYTTERYLQSVATQKIYDNKFASVFTQN